MSKYRKVLIAVDLSEHSGTVIEQARQLTAGGDVDLHLVHVIEPVMGDYSFELDLSHYEKFQHEHREAVNEQLATLLSDSGLALSDDRMHLLSGHPARHIRELCEELDIDLLVIGSHGYNAVLSALGSTTSSVMHGIGCDVLTVRIS